MHNFFTTWFFLLWLISGNLSWGLVSPFTTVTTKIDIKLEQNSLHIFKNRSAINDTGL